MVRAVSFVLALAAALSSGCFSGGGGSSITYLKLDDAVIIQLLDVPAGLSPMEEQLTLPALTLYGDGTLLRATAAGELTRAEVPEDAVHDLVEFMVKRGFLETYMFEEPGVDGPSDATTTYIYLNTKEGANSARAAGLDAPPAADASRDHERLAEIRDELLGLDASAAGPYEPGGVTIFVRRAEPGGSDSYATWPLPGVDLAALAAAESGVGTAFVPNSDAGGLAPGVATYAAGGQAFEVGVRPALPFEGRFPEFDFP